MTERVAHHWSLPIGAQTDPTGTRFRLWADKARRVEVLLYNGERVSARHALTSEAEGYFSAHVPGVRPGTRYAYSIDGGPPRPDPASRFQPEGVHGPSEVVDPNAFAWSDSAWPGLQRDSLVIYEVHIGTATPEGTFEAFIPHLDDVRDLGATAIELMPVADFPGERNWGYDGVNMFAPTRAYGGPDGLRRLVNAAHQRGLGVILDVVYNHFGPDGNYLRDFSEHYFTARHITPWGEALNFDSGSNGPVRQFYINNALMWAHEYHMDGLRFDATDKILDDSPTYILTELAARLHESLPPGRSFLCIAENDENNPAIARPADEGGWGFDGIWADDFHHQVRVALAGDREAHFGDYSGSMADLAATLQQGWFYCGQLSPNRGFQRGAPCGDLPPRAFVYCIQNHDQVGNRALGERLHHSVSPAAYRAASALLLLSPATPLLWMGQEWAASTPFQYFTDHNPELGKLVTEGRRKEFQKFAAFAGQEVPDPQDPRTFERSKLRWEERTQRQHGGVLQLYRDLLSMRQHHPALQQRARGSFGVAPLGTTSLALRYSPPDGEQLLLVVNFCDSLELDLAAQQLSAPPPGRRWAVQLNSEDRRYNGDDGTYLLNQGTLLSFNGPGAVVLTSDE
ncbi:MAG: malto-oligosyltrehalose trehalohydrolase [Chloroflexaceae bacterium]|jgi:maltooligosyltrehalose trehalohydrolase|nr:malto-oligosyltrehalose trehalohydrolase [Chloroflexaceae bacterium]